MRSLPPVLLLLTALLAASFPAAPAPVAAPHVTAELVSEYRAVQRGAEQDIALRLAPEAHWHVYWKNPGDAGLATRIEWQLPDGVRAGAIRWPAPTRFSLGEIVNYGYESETLHLVTLRVPADWAEPTLRIAATARWLVCRDICIPGSAELELVLPVTDAAPPPDPRWAPRFAEARALLPRDEPALRGQVQRHGDQLHFQLPLPAALAGARSAYLYPESADVVAHSSPQRHRLAGGVLRVAQRASDYAPSDPGTVSAVVVLDEDRRQAYRAEFVPGEVPPLTAGQDGGAGEAAALRLLGVMLAAFAGGLILNLMPCVLPVLAIKALSLAGHGRAPRAHAAAYTAGVVLSCIAVAALLLAARAAGSAAGWGFQLQNPVVVGALVYVMVAIALALAGVFTIGAGWMGAGQRLTERGGLTGSFFTGVLAVVVASPCTAPLMGAALGYALTQPAPVALAVFAALGLGLATPFALIGLFPALARWLPRPGPWMETFKQLLAFPMLLTAVWLSWVLARQTGADGVAAVLTGSVLLAMAAWLWGRPGRGRLQTLLALGLLAGAALLLRELPRHVPDSPVAADADEAWSEQRVAALLEQGHTVFVNFTADWCISCLANERVALRDDRVQALFARPDVHYLVGDWTDGDPRISEVLHAFGRPGVPLYLVYRPGQAPRILPQILTPQIVIDAIDPTAAR